ncbi:MAG: chemotaxis protein [Opitutae bacterium]|nr:chemotaxis protein [Opitutae bacterium]
MKLSTKLILGFNAVASVVLVGGGIGIYSHYSAVQNERATLASYHTTIDALNHVRNAQRHFMAEVQEWKNVLLRGHLQSDHDEYWNRFLKTEAAANQALDDLERNAPKFGIDAAAVTRVVQAHADLGRQYREALKSFKVDDPTSTAVVDKLVRGRDRPTAAAFDEMARQIDRQVEERLVVRETTLNRNARIAQTIMWVGTVIGIALGVIFGVVFSLSVARYIRSVASRIWEGTEQVSNASSQVASSSQALASATSEQASSLEETSAALEEVSSTVRQNADNARQARDLSRHNRQIADAGMAEMQSMQTAMAEIKAASDNIAKIVKSIDEIAFQTNILALNAAVEAARAGEAGMGFAVVADEVRSLAHRSAQAAKETAGMIEDAIRKSENGVQISSRISGTLEQILTDARKVDELIERIAEASSQQTQGLGQINQSLQQIDRITQGNTASSEETAAAAHDLEQLASGLKNELHLLLDSSHDVGATHAGAVKVAAIAAEEPTARSDSSEPVKAKREKVTADV